MGTASTNADGIYSGTFTAPIVDGSYPYVAEFQGAVMDLITLSPSSAKASVGVGPQVIASLANAVVPLAVGSVILFAISR